MNERLRNVDERLYSRASKVIRYSDIMLPLVLGALMSESVASAVADLSFMFLESVNRGFKFIDGLIAIVLAATLMDNKANEDPIIHSEVLAGEAPSNGRLNLFSEADRHDPLMGERRTRDLRSIQKIMLEEELELSLNETLEWGLSFYGRFAQFGSQSRMRGSMAI